MRSWRFLVSRIWITMRWLSMSPATSETISETRSPAP